METIGNNNEKMFGIYRAKCIGTSDPDGSGKILVHIYERDGRLNYDEQTHQWVPVISLYGGVGTMGLHALPPFNADGYVMFEGGNSNYPVWVGTSRYNPIRQVDDEASKKAGYPVIKTTPSIPQEASNDPQKIVFKTQNTTADDPNINSDNNPVENISIQDADSYYIKHVNKSSYTYSESGVTDSTPGSYIKLTDTAAEIGVVAENKKVFKLLINDEGVNMVSPTGETIKVGEASIELNGSKNTHIDIKAQKTGTININGKQIVQDAETISVGAAGAMGGGGVVTCDTICPYVGLPIHVGSSKVIAGG